MKETPFPFDVHLYRPCVGIMVVNKADQVFVGRRSDLPEQAPFCWQMPQGGIDAGEKPWSAALRELQEEAGIQKVLLIAESQQWYCYDFPDLSGHHFLDNPPHQPNQRPYPRPYQGQCQKWFLVRFTGQDEEIRLDTQPHMAEFSQWRWVLVHTLLSLVVPFKKEVYRKVMDEFSSYLPSFKQEVIST